MADAIQFLTSLSQSLWNGLGSVNAPVLGVSFLTLIMGVLFINLMLWAISRITGGGQDKDEKARLDNNNNYIYRRN